MTPAKNHLRHSTMKLPIVALLVVSQGFGCAEGFAPARLIARGPCQISRSPSCPLRPRFPFAANRARHDLCGLAMQQEGGGQGGGIELAKLPVLGAWLLYMQHVFLRSYIVVPLAVTTQCRCHLHIY